MCWLPCCRVGTSRAPSRQAHPAESLGMNRKVEPGRLRLLEQKHPPLRPPYALPALSFLQEGQQRSDTSLSLLPQQGTDTHPPRANRRILGHQIPPGRGQIAWSPPARLVLLPFLPLRDESCASRFYEEKDRSLLPSPAFKRNITRNLPGLFRDTCLPKEVCGGRKGKQISTDGER